MSLQRFLSLINDEGEIVPCINDRKLQVSFMILKKVRVLLGAAVNKEGFHANVIF